MTREQLGCVHVKSLVKSRVRLFGIPWTAATRLLCPWDSPGKDTVVGCHALLQGIFPTQGLDQHLLCLPDWQTCSLLLVPLGKPQAVWVNLAKTVVGQSILTHTNRI